MARTIPFVAMGKTYKANATTSSQTIQILADAPCNQVCIASHENTSGTGKPVYVAFGNSAVTVTTPANAAPQYCIVVPPGTVEVYTVPKQFTSDANTSIYAAFITESSTAECYITPGDGI